jgi:hypothetical protein
MIVIAAAIMPAATATAAAMVAIAVAATIGRLCGTGGGASGVMIAVAAAIMPAATAAAAAMAVAITVAAAVEGTELPTVRQGLGGHMAATIDGGGSTARSTTGFGLRDREQQTGRQQAGKEQ